MVLKFETGRKELDGYPIRYLEEYTQDVNDVMERYYFNNSDLEKAARAVFPDSHAKHDFNTNDDYN